MLALPPLHFTSSGKKQHPSHLLNFPHHLPKPGEKVHADPKTPARGRAEAEQCLGGVPSSASVAWSYCSPRWEYGSHTHTGTLPLHLGVITSGMCLPSLIPNTSELIELTIALDGDEAINRL